MQDTNKSNYKSETKENNLNNKENEKPKENNRNVY